MKPHLQLSLVLHTLEQERTKAITALRTQPQDADALAYKRQLDAAIACLHWCERYQVAGNSRVHVLPFPHTAFGEYVLLEADENGDCLSEAVTDTQAQPISPNGGDLVVLLGHVYNLPSSGTDTP